jgi:hypothetical protein
MASAPAQPVSTRTLDKQDEIRIVSHSNLFYWWPVWALALLMWVLTLLDGHVGAVVPHGSEPVLNAEVKAEVGDKNIDFGKRDVIVLPKNEHWLEENGVPSKLGLATASRKGYGVLFCIILLLVIVITNVPLRGMWSVVVIITIILLSIIFHLAGWWEHILRYLSYFDVRINAGGYAVIGFTLLAIWLLTTMLFDQQVYMLFTPGQLKVCTEIGGGEQVYDAMGMTVEKQRSDLFRHWILGLGSGDLIVKTAGAQAHHFDLPNVLFIGRKVAQIEEMLKKRAVIGVGAR